MRSPPPPSTSQELLASAQQANYMSQFRKRQRSPICDIPLSDPDFDGRTHKRYLSEMMANGLTLQMTLDDDGDMDRMPCDEDGMQPPPALPPATTQTQSSHSAGLCSMSDIRAMGNQSCGPLPSAAGDLPVGTCAVSGLPTGIPGGSAMPGGSGAVPAALSLGSTEPASISSFRLRPERVASMRSTMRSPPADFSPTSPSQDTRYFQDLRKTALLRSILMRTDENVLSGAGTAGSDLQAAWVSSAGVKSSMLQPSGCHAPIPCASIPMPPPVPGGFFDERNDGMQVECTQAGWDGTSRARPLPPALPSTSRSESLPDTVNSMDTESTTGSSAFEEVEQSRRMGLYEQPVLDNIIGSGAAAVSNTPVFSRRMSGGTGALRHKLTVLTSFPSATSDLAAAAVCMLPPRAPSRPVPAAASPCASIPTLDQAVMDPASTNIDALRYDTSHPIAAHTVPVPSSDELVFAQLRARAVAESAKLGGKMEDYTVFCASGVPPPVASTSASPASALFRMPPSTCNMGMSCCHGATSLAGTTRTHHAQQHISTEGNKSKDAIHCSSGLAGNV